jgi:hypothetical protein
LPKREPIFDALAKRLQAVDGIATFERKLKHWDNVPASQQPALFMAAAGQTVERQGRGLSALTIRVQLYLYNRNNDGTSQNDLLDAIDDALAPVDSEPDYGVECTLGGLVSSCRIEGEIETDEGLLGDQAVAIVPIVVVVP